MIKDFSKPIENNVKILELNATLTVWNKIKWLNLSKRVLEILFNEKNNYF